jgi:RiboL-PSP-HEPN
MNSSLYTELSIIDQMPKMNRAIQSFEFGIKDAEELLSHFDAINSNPPPANSEVLKRAGLVMALTAWETYVEDKLLEEMNKKLGVVAGSYIGNFVLKKLQQDLKQFHNPTSEKTKRIFLEYLGLDVTEGWSWSNYEPEKARTTLNAWIAKRGDAVHRSKPLTNGASIAHLIKRDELEKVIRFIKDLVKATDSFIEKSL